VSNLCYDIIFVFKVISLKSHCTSKNEGYCANLSSDARARKQKVGVELKKRGKKFSSSTVQKKLQEVASRLRLLVVYNTAKHSEPFSYSEFVKQCTVDVAEVICSENKT